MKELESNPNPDLARKFLELRTLTETTGAIHEAQVYQIKVWWNILFDKVKAKISLSPDENKIIFECEEKTLKGVKKRMKIMTNSLRFLLGNWTIQLKNKGKEVYRDGRSLTSKDKQKIDYKRTKYEE